MQKEGRGSAEEDAEPRFLVIGKIIKPHGVIGEVRVEIHTDTPERYSWLDSVYVGQSNPQLITIESVRYHKNWVLLKLAGIDDRNDAEALRSKLILIPESEGLPLEEGEYYLYQIIGFEVVSDNGIDIGRVTEVLETNANNVFIVEGPLGEILVPDIDDVILSVNHQSRLITIHPMEGLF
jgi:16S rRNA processing protein RimM